LRRQRARGGRLAVGRDRQVAQATQSWHVSVNSRNNGEIQNDILLTQENITMNNKEMNKQINK
jgi:hypothetical protein